jgi:glycosyltransferase involved in cell wall biosynthesis
MSVCLAMMCKNESKLIRTALASVKPFIDSWSIVDTGSEDNTKNVILEELAGIPGTLFERPWINWEHNRTEAIKLAKLSGCDFIFILDADEKVIPPPGFKLDLNPDLAYWVTIKYGTTSYGRPNILSAKHNWHYVGVTHEYLTAQPDNPPVVVLPIILETNIERTNKTPEKCALDAELLEAGLLTEPENARYRFYLAQSYRDSNRLELAIKNYEQRVKMGGWFEEVWYAQFQVAEIKMRLNHPAPEVIQAYLTAYELNPNRSESLGALARYLRLQTQYHLAQLFAARAKDTPRPNEQLFIDETYYNWRNLDEFAVAAFWTGCYKESCEASTQLLTSGKLPAWEQERVKKNLNFALEKLPHTPEWTAAKNSQFAVPPASESLNVIPEIIHQSWKDTNIPNVYHKEWVKSWSDKHPGWKMMFWTDADNEALVRECYPEFYDFYRTLTPGVKKADFSRLLYMHRYGGVYTDLDNLCLKNLSPLLAGHDIVLGRLSPENWFSYLSNDFMASCPGLEFWIKQARDVVAAPPNEVAVVGLHTGPMRMQMAYETYKPERTLICEPEVIYPLDWVHLAPAFQSKPEPNPAFRPKLAAIAEKIRNGLSVAEVAELLPNSYVATAWSHNW